MNGLLAFIAGPIPFGFWVTGKTATAVGEGAADVVDEVEETLGEAGGFLARLALLVPFVVVALAMIAGAIGLGFGAATLRAKLEGK